MFAHRGKFNCNHPDLKVVVDAFARSHSSASNEEGIRLPPPIALNGMRYDVGGIGQSLLVFNTHTHVAHLWMDSSSMSAVARQYPAPFPLNAAFMSSVSNLCWHGKSLEGP